MNETYSIWTHLPDQGITTCVPGIDIPRFANGEPQEQHNQLVMTFKADSMEKAFEFYDQWLEQK